MTNTNPVLPRYFVSQAGTVASPKKLSLLFGLLSDSVGRHIMSARVVCEMVLSCDKLHHENKHHWVASFTLVRRIVGGVDYKGVREIMKNCIEKVSSLPLSLDNSVSPQLDCLQVMYCDTIVTDMTVL